MHRDWVHKLPYSISRYYLVDPFQLPIGDIIPVCTFHDFIAAVVKAICKLDLRVVIKLWYWNSFSTSLTLVSLLQWILVIDRCSNLRLFFTCCNIVNMLKFPLLYLNFFAFILLSLECWSRSTLFTSSGIFFCYSIESKFDCRINCFYPFLSLALYVSFNDVTGFCKSFQ